MAHRNFKVGVEIAYVAVAHINVEAQLLVAGVIVDVGARCGLCADIYGIFRDHKTRLQHNLLRVVLGVDLQQIVARQAELEIFVGKGYVVVHVVCGCGL